MKLDGQVDALVFAGGIGEKSALIRRVLTEKCACLGFGIDQGKNEKGPEEEETVLDVSKGKDGPRVLVVQTNEQVSFFSFFLALFLLVTEADWGSLKWRITVRVLRSDI